jgi:signal transduction histidine kinase
VARQWRIRHKLMLGLGLVLAIVALLLIGALKGLSSYKTTINTIDGKLQSLNDYAVKLQYKILKLGESSGSNTEAILLTDKVADARKLLNAYQSKLKELGKYGNEYDQAYKETNHIEALQEQFVKLSLAMNQAIEKGEAVLENDTVKDQIKKLNATATELVSDIYIDCYDRFGIAARDYRFSLRLMLSTSIVGLLLMVGLLRFFYRWMFYPIRDLQQGVARVAEGNFEHTIDIRSSDEIQDLAAAFNDMTGRLREMYRDLARQVNERSRQLVRSERLAGVGFLAAGVAHEINNPLASIAFCSEALERRLADVMAAGQRTGTAAADLEVVAKYLRMIQQEAFRCKEITQRLLEFSRGGERRRESTDLGELIQGVLEVVQHLQNCKGKKLIFDPPPRLVAPVNGQEIKSVVLNLIVNALDSMEEGGTLTIKLRQRDGMAEMVFADTGCGMTAEVLENIFEPFFTRSRTGKGTGLGLSISHRIINQHRGEIEAVSAGPDEGSTFTVRLPLRVAEEAAGRDGGSADREQEAAAEQDWARNRKRAA